MMQKIYAQDVYNFYFQNCTSLTETKLDGDMKKGEILSFQTTDKKMNFMKWMETKAVYLISNSQRSGSKISTERRQKGSSDKASIAVPENVNEYYKYMGDLIWLTSSNHIMQLIFDANASSI